jgi:hypothetical protein
MRLGHADGEDAVARAYAGQEPPLDRLRRMGGDDAGLHADLAQHRHGGDVASLGDLLEHERGVEDRKLRAAIGLGHRHAEHADLGETADIVPGERAVHVLQAARLELALRELADGGDDALLLVAELEAERRRVLGHHGRAHGRLGAGRLRRLMRGRP